MMPMGPSLGVKGSLVSSSKDIIINSKQNAKVFPKLVNAILIMSQPEKLSRKSE